jgi:UrcA family protein
MEIETSASHTASHPKITLLMVLCGLVGVAAAGAANAAKIDDSVPKIAIQLDSASFASDSAAQGVYRRIVRAAEQACAQTTVGSRIVSPAVEQCRAQVVANAVHQINNPRLVAVYNSSTKRG